MMDLKQLKEEFEKAGYDFDLAMETIYILNIAGEAYRNSLELKPGDINEDGLEIEQDGFITRFPCASCLYVHRKSDEYPCDRCSQAKNGTKNMYR